MTVAGTSVAGRVVREPRLRNVRGIGLAASWAIGGAAAVDVASAVGDWWTTQAPAVATGDTELRAVDWYNLVTVVLTFGSLIAAAVLFIVWLLRARENSEFLCDARHYYSRSIGVFGWIVPVAGWWMPCRYVQNVAVASDPGVGPRGAWIDSYKNNTVTTWWVLWLVQSFFDWLVFRSELGLYDGDPSQVFKVALLSSISAVLSVAGAVFAVLVIRTINRLQSSRPPVPWWHQPL
jgi:hypothetical protein